MTLPVYILDSHALMVFFQMEKGHAEVKRLVTKASHKECILKMSIINWGEIYYSTVKSKGKTTAEQVLALIEQLPIQLIDVDQNMVHTAAIYKSLYPIAYADCFTAALAKKENATVVTGDPEFKFLVKDINILWLK